MSPVNFEKTISEKRRGQKADCKESIGECEIKKWCLGTDWFCEIRQRAPNQVTRKAHSQFHLQQWGIWRVNRLLPLCLKRFNSHHLISFSHLACKSKRSDTSFPIYKWNKGVQDVKQLMPGHTANKQGHRSSVSYSNTISTTTNQRDRDLLSVCLMLPGNESLWTTYKVHVIRKAHGTLDRVCFSFVA